MKVAAISPQFVIETPEPDQVEEQKRLALELGDLKVVAAASVEEPPTDNLDQETLHQETRDGLRRLTELIRSKQQQKERGDKERKSAVARRKVHELKRSRALALYQTISSHKTLVSAKGRTIDEFY